MSTSCDLQCCDDNDQCLIRNTILNRPTFAIVTLSGYGLLGPFETEQSAIDYAKRLWGQRVAWMVRRIEAP